MFKNLGNIKKKVGTIDTVSSVVLLTPDIWRETALVIFFISIISAVFSPNILFGA